MQAVLPDYDVAKELGRGAMGIVYLATHRALGRTVAVKELPSSFATDPSVRERFLDEARVVASLDHPHVVVIHDFVDRDGHLALVMEHLPNGTVWDQFLHHGLAAPRACGLTLATLAGLHHAHERGVMHRDIKPENLIFTHDWQLKVTDFGIAQVLTGDITMGTEEGAIVGTPAYMSPEQAEGRSCGPPADVYASGVMLYEMLTGALPFPNGETAMAMALARLSEDPVPINAVGPAVPEPIAEATMHALTRSDTDRFATAEEFGVALAEAAAHTWGPEWMSESGTAVRGSLAIEQAARTTDRSIAVPDVGFGDARETAADPEASAAPAAPPASPNDTEAVGDDRETAAPAPSAEPTADATAIPAGAPAPQPPQVPQPIVVYAELPTAAVVPQQKEHVAGADLNDLVPDDIIDLKSVRAPSSSLPSFLAGLVAVVLAAIFALTGLGDDPVAQNARSLLVAGTSPGAFDQPVEIDLTEPFPFFGAESLSASFLGIPIGAPTVEDGQLDPGYLQYTGAGVIEFTVNADELGDVADDAADGSETADSADASESVDDSGTADATETPQTVSFPVRVANSPYPTAPFVASLMLGLGGLASVQANMRGMRTRQVRVSPYIGLLISGALTGAAAAVFGMVMFEAPADPTTVILCAGLAGVGCALVGDGYRRFYRRRRLKRFLVNRSRR